MPIEYDDRPGSANRQQRTKDGQLPGPIKQPGENSPITTMRIRLLQPVKCRLGIYQQGQVVDLPEDTARSWIGFGLAEQDKMLAGPPEIKAEQPLETKTARRKRRKQYG